jgi:superfamily I DNA and/or RNA helicase
VEYVRKLLNLKCTVDDIGIITPYRKQVWKQP